MRSSDGISWVAKCLNGKVQPRTFWGRQSRGLRSSIGQRLYQPKQYQSPWVKVRSLNYSSIIHNTDQDPGTDKLYVRRQNTRDRIESSLTPDFPDHPQRVVQRRCLRRISRLKCAQSRRSGRELQETALQLLRGISATLRTPSLHSRRHHLRPHKHPTMDQKARNEPCGWEAYEERGSDQTEVCQKR